MTLSTARKRYPSVPIEIIRWAILNIPDPGDLELGLRRLEQARQIAIKYGV
jgi:hypothetical protein